jgi:hypothetical protein
MRFALAAFAALLVATAASAQVYVQGYTTKDGTYVAPHYRSAPDGNPYNNWSTRGNVNPYTGQVGTRNPSPSTSFGSIHQWTPAPTCLYCAPTTQPQTSTDDGSPY